MTRTLLSALALSLAAAGAAQAASSATSTLYNPDGQQVGTVSFTQTPAGVLLEADLSALQPGEHGFHIHETGECTRPDFQSAGGHFAPEGNDHGFLAENGPHAGDVPNIHVGDSGSLTVEVLNRNISLTEGESGYLFDDDGSAMMIHSGADDYESQPSGDAGSRIACGLIEQTG